MGWWRCELRIGAFFSSLICISRANRGKLGLSRAVIGTICTPKRSVLLYSVRSTEYISLRIKIVGCNVASQVDHDDDIYGERGGRRTALLEDHEM